MHSPKPLPASTALTATLDSSIAVNKEQFLWMWHFADFTIYTVGLTQWAAAGDPLSQIVFPDHSELPPHAAFQMQHSLRFNHCPHSLMSHIQLPLTCCSAKTREDTVVNIHGKVQRNTEGKARPLTSWRPSSTASCCVQVLSDAHSGQ